MEFFIYNLGKPRLLKKNHREDFFYLFFNLTLLVNAIQGGRAGVVIGHD